MHTWIDAAYGVYNDTRSQIGGAISLGWSRIHEKSTIQKLNTKSSTESEVVGFSNYLPHKYSDKEYFTKPRLLYKK